MIYYISKVFWLIAAPTSALVLIGAIAACWAVLRSPNRVAWLAAAATGGLVIGTFTPLGLMLTVPLDYRFALSPPSQSPPDGIILLGGVAGWSGVEAVSALSQHYPKARLIFSGFDPGDENVLKDFAQLGGDPARIYMEPRARTTFEDALYAAALLKPKPTDRWMLVTSAMHMPRAIGCFRVGISGGAASGSISNRPIESICWIRSWSASLILPRRGREGVDRPHCLSAHGQDRRAVSGAIVAEIRWSNPCATIPAAWRYSPRSAAPRSG